MHDDIEPFSQSPSQKFHKNSTNFENPKKISKTQNLYLNALNAWRMRDKEHTRRKKNDLEVEKLLGREFEVRKKGLGRWKVRNCWQRSREMKSKSRGPYL